MGSTGKRRRQPRRGLKRSVPWICLGLLATATGFLGGRLYRDLPRGPGPAVLAERDPRTSVEALLGPLVAGVTRVRVADRAAVQWLRQQLEEVTEGAPTVTVTPLTHDNGSVRFSVVIDGASHPVELWWPAPPPRLAVVIDDMGRDLERAEAFLDLKIPVTPSIIPHLRRSREVAAAARARGRPYLLHLPMQPRNYPETDPGRGALLEEMGEAEMRRTVAEDLAAVPGVSGVNNHMGSRLTELEEPLRWVMDELAQRGLFFLDSVTSAETVAATVAREAGLATARRDVFIDNTRQAEAIGQQIRRAVKKARDNRSAVLIGHPYLETLEALRKATVWIRAEGVVVVPLKELVSPLPHGT